MPKYAIFSFFVFMPKSINFNCINSHNAALNINMQE